MIKPEKSFGTMVGFQTTYRVIWWSLWYRGSPVSTVLISNVPGLVQFVNSTKIEKKVHFKNLIEQFLAFSTKSVPHYCGSSNSAVPLCLKTAKSGYLHVRFRSFLSLAKGQTFFNVVLNELCNALIEWFFWFLQLH